MIQFLKYQKIFYILSALLILTSLFFLNFWGLKFGIDFVGGSIFEVEFEKRPENPLIEEKIKNLNLGEVIVQPVGDKGVLLRMKDLEEEMHQQVLNKLKEISPLQEKRFESIGPTIGQELRKKTIILILFSLIVLLFYLVIVFRKITFPVSGWQCAFISIFALFFDVFVTFGVLAFLGHFSDLQLNIPIITAMLTILGYTINDKVIVLDRLRENLLKRKFKNFKELTNQSLNEVLGRSLSTGTCSLLVLFFIFFLGGESLKYFAITLILGIIVGTYSSLFLATPLLVFWAERKRS